MRSSFPIRLVLALLLLALAGCDRKGSRKRDPVLAVAFAGPVTLPLRAEISPKSNTIATAKHGERIEVVQVRRRFVRVRTPRGDEGWTELRNLLGPEQMEQLRRLANRAAKLPSQGEATVYTTLNIHAEPSRTSTSFYQLVEGARADVVGHQLVPRSTAPASGGFRIEKPKPPVRVQKEKKPPKVPPPPRPLAPGLPANWQDLSRTQTPEPAPEELVAQAKRPEKKVPLDDWSLIRTKNGKAGWVLTRNLTMAIPDEVAQYSEGARITSYFALKAVQDGDQTKHHWLWTTMRDTGEAYDFDSFRIFIYMLRRHRYETAYIERRVEGYYPVTVEAGDTPGFALIVRDETGLLVRRRYVLEGYNVRKVGEEPYSMKAGTPGATIAGKAPADEEPDGGDGDEKPATVMERLRRWLSRK